MGIECILDILGVRRLWILKCLSTAEQVSSDTGKQYVLLVSARQGGVQVPHSVSLVSVGKDP